MIGGLIGSDCFVACYAAHEMYFPVSRLVRAW